MKKGDVEALRAHVNKALDTFPPSAEMDFVFVFAHVPSNAMQMVTSFHDAGQLELALDHVLKRVQSGEHERERFPAPAPEPETADAGPNLRCDGCSHVGAPETFPPSISPYHDFVCPICGTSQVDTSELAAAWAARGENYGYGDHNLMDFGG